MGVSPNLTEREQAIRQRLKDDGRWDEAEEFLGKCVYYFRKEKRYDNYDANRLAWKKVEERFPPTEEQLAAEEKLEEIVVSADLESADFDNDFLWAYTNIASKGVTAKDAPSGGAWTLLEYGRSAKAKFIELALRYFTQSKKQSAQEEMMEDDRREQLKLVDALLASSQEAN